MEARGALLSSDETYAPPVYDEVAGTISAQQPPPVSSVGRPRRGVSWGTSDAYVALNAADDGSDATVHREERANQIAMRRQQEHAKAFQRQVEAEEEFLRSSQRQVERDAQVAARLAAGHDESAAFDAIQQAQRDAEMAARLQSEYDHRGRTARPTVKTTKKTVRVLVPATARPGDSLAVKTSSMGKFEITVPEWARPDSHFDCLITTTIEIVPLQRTRQTANRNAYQPPLPPDNLPPGWERGATPDGVPFYVDHNTRTTHWAPPSTPAPAPASSAPASSAPASSAPGEAALSRMTEEEMLAEAIARSLQDAPPAEAEVPEDDPPQDSDAHDVVDEVPAGSETDLLGLGDPSRDDGPQTPPPPPQGDHQQPQPPAI